MIIPCGVSRPRGRHLLAVAGLLALAMVAIPLTASAHENRTVADDYEFVVGFVTEPAIAGEVNGVLLEVSSGGQPVEGLSDTIQVQIILGDQTKDVTLTPAFDAPGTYTSTFIPTVEGDYTFRFQGEIEGLAIDETFTSSPEGFASVEPRSDYEFPAAESSAVRSVALPALVGAVLLAVGGAGLAIRQRRTSSGRVRQ